ncbi:hypothetical protein [Flavobacterium sp. 14A]|uniref:hypothetical protein n=1 Tax=Flavobacterium sp. 14A TaxID=2735896 RepID=UPI00156FB5E4|nr:hypothetical protein [Flavobacterium sp. 14A]NRT13469.1 hypothetical protein [Flavobacterium sp. 14A]
MIKKQLFLPTFLAMTVLFAMLFQSLHTYEHLIKQLAQTECHHKYNPSHTEITHQHHNYDSCKVCHFSFGNYIAPVSFTYKVTRDYAVILYPGLKRLALISFTGCLYSHRGPPAQIT